MRARRGWRSRLVPLTAVGLSTLLPGMAAGGSRAVAVPVEPGQHGSSSLDNFLEGVSAANASNVWAVGYYSAAAADQTLIEYWNGSTWAIQPSLDPGGPRRDSRLSGVAAVSPSLAWAVGNYRSATRSNTLIVRWDGSAWHHVLSPDVKGSTSSGFNAVTAFSATSAWAVGEYWNGHWWRTLIEHWNGTSWKIQPSPNLGIRSDFLFGVAAVSASSAWAAGYYFTGTDEQTLIEHWNGKAWKIQRSPDLGGTANTSDLFGAAAASPSSVWAVGNTYPARVPLIEHWTDRRWKLLPTSKIGFLDGVAFTSRSSGWAVGDGPGSQPVGAFTLIERWNGATWTKVASPSIGPNNHLSAVAATSQSSAWAVGEYFNGVISYQTLIEQWNGDAWQVVHSPNS